MHNWNLKIFFLLWLPVWTFAQFQFFDHVFQGAHQQHQQHHQHHQQQQQNVASDSSWYRQNYEAAPCSNYLCPKTLSCVHFPHHCPCAFPESQDKFELGEGVAVCVSKGGWKDGEAGRKIELARKGLL
ncbi:MAG: Long chronological lifespan protein 2 [Lichina confinis]|nr:MAG: Long chronological lifespan protein 2 [Lichina confinis]